MAIRIRPGHHWVYVDANFAIGPFVWQIEVDQYVKEFDVEANVGIGPIDWQLELDQEVTEN